MSDHAITSALLQQICTRHPILGTTIMSAALVTLDDGNKIPALGFGRSLFVIPPPRCTLTVRTLDRLGFLWIKERLGASIALGEKRAMI